MRTELKVEIERTYAVVSKWNQQKLVWEPWIDVPCTLDEHVDQEYESGISFLDHYSDHGDEIFANIRSTIADVEPSLKEDGEYVTCECDKRTYCIAEGDIYMLTYEVYDPNEDLQEDRFLYGDSCPTCGNVETACICEDLSAYDCLEPMIEQPEDFQL